MNNKVYLVSKIFAYTTDTMNKYYKIFKDEDSAKTYFNTLVEEYKIDSMDYYGCSREELPEYLEMFEGNYLFTALTEGGETELEIQLEMMEVL